MPYEIKTFRSLKSTSCQSGWLCKGMGRGRFIAMESPQDPKPSLKIEGGRIVELDG